MAGVCDGNGVGDGDASRFDLVLYIQRFGEDESGEVYVVGYNGRIYVFDPLPGETPTAIHQTDAGAPQEFALAQNFPNPFNPVTSIPLVIPAGGRVELMVYDLLGRLRIRGIRHHEQASARHQFRAAVKRQSHEYG